MARKSTGAKSVASERTGARTLTMADARSFGRSVKAMTLAASRDSASAKKFLIKSKLLTRSGRLATIYRTTEE